MATNSYSFPTMDDVEIYRARIRGFIIAAIFAAVPFVFSWVWHALDGNITPATLHVVGENGLASESHSSRFLGVPDLAFAGVVFAITAITNTTLSFVKLAGWKSSRWLTFLLLLSSGVSSIACFVIYLRSVYGSENVDEGQMFWAAVIMTALTLVSGFMAQITFVGDEIDSARRQVNQL